MTYSVRAVLLLAILSSGAAAADVIKEHEWPVEGFDMTAAMATTDDFETHRVVGFSVHVEDTLRRDSPSDVSAFLALIEANLTRIVHVVRPEDIVHLRDVGIWATDNPCGRTAAYFHTNRSWLEANGRPGEMVDGIEFCRLDVLVREDRLSTYLLHELAHAFHHGQIEDGFDNEIIHDAYDRQLRLMLYAHVLKRNGDYGEAHANSNALEYFAHLSVKRLGTDDEYPFVAAELRHHDPWGFQVVDAVWAGGLESSWIDCDRLETVRSGYDGAVTLTLRFWNDNDESRSIIWIDHSGAVRWDYHEWKARPDEVQAIKTYRNHRFAVFDEDRQCVGIFSPGIASETVRLP